MTQVLNIPLEDKTLKKLKALAMLSDIKVTDLEAEISGLIDQMLSDNIAIKMAELDGKPMKLVINQEVETVAIPAAPVVEEDPNAHGLSEDEASEEVLSSEEQIAKEAKPAAPAAPVAKKEDDIYKLDIDAPVAGDDGEDAEAFVDAPAPVSKNKATVSTPYGRATAPKGFDPRKPLARVRIADFTGDEDGDQNWFNI